MKILMVCLGNICRSPLAEGILRDKVSKAGLDWIIDSAGTNHYETGFAPHKLSQDIARLHGVEIKDQRCRQFVKEDMLLFDKIYVMDESNFNDVKRIAGNLWDASKVDLLLNQLPTVENKNIPDPWYGGFEDFKKVYAMLDEACEVIIKKYIAAQQQQQQ